MTTSPSLTRRLAAILLLALAALLLPGCPSMDVDLRAYDLQGRPVEGLRVSPGEATLAIDSAEAERGTTTGRRGRATISIPMPPAVPDDTRTLSIRGPDGSWWETGIAQGTWVFSTDPDLQKTILRELEFTAGDLVPALSGTPDAGRRAYPAVVRPAPSVPRPVDPKPESPIVVVLIVQE